MRRIAALLCFLIGGVNALAQTPNSGTLRVTVVDPSNAVVAGADVTVVGVEDATKGAVIAPVQTSEDGVAVVPGLRPGRYTVQASFPGFDTRTLADVRVRNGDNKQVAVLAIARIEASLTVGQDKQEAAADRQGPSFGAALTRDQIEALSDDPATLRQQLQDMAGPGAVIRIDGFEGSALPAKAQIRSIRISRDQFASEYHNAGGTSIEIITQPGIGPVRYFSNFAMRNGALSGRSPFVPVRGPEQFMLYGFGAGGGLIKDKASFNLNAFGNSSYDTPNLNVALPTGTISRALNLKSPRDNIFVNGQLDYALSLDQTLRFGYNANHFASENAGVGGYDEPERAYSTHNTSQAARVQHFGPVRRRAFSRSRVQLSWTDSGSTSVTEAPTIRVLDAFTRGGAQRAGGDHSRVLNIGSDLDYVLGRHSLRSGVLLDAGWYHSDTTSNYLGTYTFDNLAAFQANQPSNYSRRIGDPRVAYRMIQGGIYLQDDIRLRKNLTITPGIRYELQTHVDSTTSLGPRFGATWAPFGNGQTTLRGSIGMFYDWLPTGTYDQTIRVDGLRQQELNITNPAFPDAGMGGVVPPINRYVLGDQYQLPRITRVSAGIDQGMFKVTRVAATYSYQRSARLAGGLNVNQAVNGIRPNPAFANIVDVVSVAAARQHQLQVDANINPGALLPAFNGPLISWKRTTVFLNYTLAKVENNTDGPFSIPATGNLTDEWGPSGAGQGGGGFFVLNGIAIGAPGPGTIDVRNRLNVNFNNQIIRNVMLSLGVNTSTAPPYTLLSGRDDNNDGVFNDRPAGVGRNSARASGQTVVFLFAAYQFAFGTIAPLPPGVGVFGGGGAAQVRTFDQGNKRYRMQLFVQAQNLTNQRNYAGYSGTMTSPFFGKPTTVSSMRKIDVGISLQF
jgi:hypothetical protein